MKKLFGLLLAVLLLLPSIAQPVLAQSLVPTSVHFERVNETPVSVTFRVTITNNATGQRHYPVKALFADMSTPVSQFKDLDISQVWLASMTEQVPVSWETQQKSYTSLYGVYENSLAEEGFWTFTDYSKNGMEILKSGGYITFSEPLMTWYWTEDVAIEFETHDWTVEQTVATGKWGLRGRSDPPTMSLSAPKSDDNAYGWGNGVSVYDVTINTGLQNRATGWGSKGLLKLDIAGTLFYDNQNSSWWDSVWTMRKKLTIDNSTVAENLINFPVLVSLNAARIDYADTQDAGQDIRFVDDDDVTPLDYEIEDWDETGTSSVWVEVPQIDSGSAVDFIYMYYGNPVVADGQNVAGTWNASYKAVYHSYDNPDISHIADSTGVNNGTKVGAGNPAEIAGQIYYGQDYDGADSRIQANDNASIRNLFDGGGTVMAWINPANAGESGWGQITQKSATNWLRYFHVRDLAAGNVRIAMYMDFNGVSDGSWWSTQIFPTGAWSLATMTYDADNVANNPVFYRNGAVSATTISVVPIGTRVSDAGIALAIGNTRAQNLTFDGVIDEIRLYDGVATANWIKAEYLSQSDTYITYAAVETYPQTPTNLVIVENGNNLILTWTVGAGATTTVIVRGEYQYPVNPMDGITVYNGAAATYTDLGANSDLTQYYYTAWSHSAFGYSIDFDNATGGGTGMVYMMLALIAVGLTIAMFTTRNSLLGFPSAIFWWVLGGYAYQRSVATWDTDYFIFFSAMFVGVFAAFAAYALRKKDLAGPDADKGAFIDEGKSDNELDKGDGDRYIDEASVRGDVGDEFERKVKRGVLRSRRSTLNKSGWKERM